MNINKGLDFLCYNSRYSSDMYFYFVFAASSVKLMLFMNKAPGVLTYIHS